MDLRQAQLVIQKVPFLYSALKWSRDTVRDMGAKAGSNARSANRRHMASQSASS